MSHHSATKTIRSNATLTTFTWRWRQARSLQRAWWVDVARVASAPVSQKPERACQLAARGTQLVHEARRPLGVALRKHEPLRLEAAQPLGEDVGRDAGELLLEVAKPPRPVEQGGDDQQRPAVPDARKCLR